MTGVCRNLNLLERDVIMNPRINMASTETYHIYGVFNEKLITLNFLLDSFKARLQQFNVHGYWYFSLFGFMECFNCSSQKMSFT
jgi:hypothetical protein